MGDVSHVRFDPLLPADEAKTTLRLCERFGRCGTDAAEDMEQDFGESIGQHHDAAAHFAQTGGRLGRRESGQRLIARTHYRRGRPAATGTKWNTPGWRSTQKILPATRQSKPW